MRLVTTKEGDEGRVCLRAVPREERASGHGLGTPGASGPAVHALHPPAGGATGASALGEAAGVQGLWEQELDPKASPVLGQVAM